jgi:hypothetical protein
VSWCPTCSEARALSLGAVLTTVATSKAASTMDASGIARRRLT